MRIEYLHIDGLRNLRDFSISFQDKQFTTVLIGENGTGKSNLLEAIVRIFRDLDLAERPEFGFHIIYRCRGIRVNVYGTPGERQRVFVGAEGSSKRLSWVDFQRDKENLLPKYVFAYYSGPSTRMQHYFDRHQKLFYDAILNNDSGEAAPIRRLFYCQPEHSRWVLLAYFLRGNEPPTFLKRNFGIDAFDSALLVLHRPDWAEKYQTTPPAEVRRLGDERFWWARGTVKSFLQRLWDQSIAPIYVREEYQSDYRARAVREERLYLFLPSTQALQKLNTRYEDEAALFAALESTDISHLVRDVRVRVMRNGESILFSEMSEGEQQLLTVVGLMQFTRHEESLFLLDEPDTHLNPIWKLSYLTELARQSGLLAEDGEVDGGEEAWLDQTSQLILTTHDPLTIAGLRKMQVKIFDRFTDDSIAVRIPEEDPQGMGVAGVLLQMFGLPSTLDTITQGKINRRNELSRIDRTSAEESEFRRLSSELGALGLVYEARDPQYRLYLKALHQWEQDRKTRIDQLSHEEQDQRVLSILASLNSEEQQS